MVFKKNHYVTFNHCTSLPHIIFCIMFLLYLNILFYYYVLLPLILTIVTCMYYYCILQAMYGPSLINYCLLSIVYCRVSPQKGPGIVIIGHLSSNPFSAGTVFKPLTAGAAYNRVFIFISTLSTTS